MIDKTGPTPPPHDPIYDIGAHYHPTKHVGPHIEVPEAYKKAGFTEDDYKKYLDEMTKSLSHEMDKVTNKQIQALKEQRQKIESGEE